MDVSAMCCPSPSNSVIAPIGTSGEWRRVLYWIAIGDLVNCVLKALVLGILQGVFNLVNVWIDYISYATMHFCQTMILSFSAIFDIVLLAMNYSHVPNHTLIRVAYWTIVSFTVLKLFAGIGAYLDFKKAWLEQ